MADAGAVQEDAGLGKAGAGHHSRQPSALDSAKLMSDKSEGGSHSSALFQWLRLLLFELLALITQVRASCCYNLGQPAA